MQALSRREENEVMDIAKEEALGACQDYVRTFAECASGRTFSMGWACKGHLKAMRACMHEKVPESRIDEIKLDYIKNRDERKVQAIEAYKQERIEAMKRHAGIKDDPVAPSAPTQQPYQISTPSRPISQPEPVWTEEAPRRNAGYGR